MKVVVTDYIHADQEFERVELEKAGLEFESHQLKFTDPDLVFSKVSDANIIVVNMVPFPSEFIQRLTSCKLLIRHGIGYDNVNVDACTKMGIQFSYQPAYCATEVAEHAISLILGLYRKSFLARDILEKSSKLGDWNFDGLFPIHRLEGKKLGVLGLGRIGRKVAQKAIGLGMTVITADPYVGSTGIDFPVEFVDKETLFRDSDIISLHCLVTEETDGIVNRKTLSLMKPTAYLVNTARAALIRTNDLVACLQNGQISGAAIDVFDTEPPPPDHPLFKLNNVILTPHMGWASIEAGWQIRKDIVADIKKFADGGDARYVINKETLRKPVVK